MSAERGNSPFTRRGIRPRARSNKRTGEQHVDWANQIYCALRTLRTLSTLFYRSSPGRPQVAAPWSLAAPQGRGFCRMKCRAMRT